MLIELHDVRKIFTAAEVETHALGGVHLEIRRGEYVSIEGPSGSGNTTLLSILGLLDAPTGGTHNPEHARQATRTIHLFDGRIVDEALRGVA